MGKPTSILEGFVESFEVDSGIACTLDAFQTVSYDVNILNVQKYQFTTLVAIFVASANCTIDLQECTN